MERILYTPDRSVSPEGTASRLAWLSAPSLAPNGHRQGAGPAQPSGRQQVSRPDPLPAQRRLPLSLEVPTPSQPALPPSWASAFLPRARQMPPMDVKVPPSPSHKPITCPSNAPRALQCQALVSDNTCWPPETGVMAVRLWGHGRPGQRGEVPPGAASNPPPSRTSPSRAAAPPLGAGSQPQC